MILPSQFLERLQCPITGHPLHVLEGAACEQDGLSEKNLAERDERVLYPVVDGIPVLLPEAARRGPAADEHDPVAAWLTGHPTDPARQAEIDHAARLETREGLVAKPFAGGTSANIDRCLLDIAAFRAMATNIPHGAGATVLDLGAGPCWVSEWLQLLGYTTCSLDLSLDMLAIGRERLAPGSWMCAADMAALPLADASVDAAVCYAALHHVPNWPRVVSEVYRVLRPGGVLVLQEPGRRHASHPESIAQMQLFGTLEQSLPPGELARACRRAGFSRVVIRPLPGAGTGRMRILPVYRFWRYAPRLFALKTLQRLVGECVERLLNLGTRLHVVVATKGCAWADSLRPDTPVCRFRSVSCPDHVTAGTRFKIVMDVLNTGMTRWLCRTDGGIGQVQAGISLLDRDGKLVDLDFARLPLPRDVLPGETVTIAGVLIAPESVGPAGLQVDMVAEGITWFSAQGSRVRRLPLQIEPATPDKVDS